MSKVPSAKETKKNDRAIGQHPKVIGIAKHREEVARLENRIKELENWLSQKERIDTENIRVERKTIALRESVSISAARAVLEALDVDYKQEYKDGAWRLSVEIVSGKDETA